MARTSIDDELLPRAPRGTEWVPVGRGESGHRLYRLSSGDAYAKVASHRQMELVDERLRAEWLFARGLPAPNVLDWREMNKSACLVTASIPGVPADLLAPSELRGAWPALCRALKAIHALPTSECPFERRMSSMIAHATEVVGRHAVRSSFLRPADRNTPPTDLLARLNVQLPTRVMQEQDDLVVCHGDACLPNLLVDPETLRCTGVVDLGRLGLADRYADLSLLTANALSRWRDDDDAMSAEAELFSTHGIKNADRDRMAFYLALDPLTWG